MSNTSKWDTVRDRALTALGYGLLALVEAAVALMSWTGLVGFARTTLHLDGLAALLVPISLDGAAAAAAFIALRTVVRGDSAAGSRLMVVGFTGASAWLNWHHATTTYADGAAAVFFAGMSVAVLALFDLVMREIRRASLRSIGAVEQPIARFRALRWARFPRETWAAWSAALRFGLTTPAEALAYVEQRPATGSWAGLVTVDDLPAAELGDGLDGLSKADLARRALAATNGEVTPALAWLAERGRSVDRSYVYEVRRATLAAQALGQLPGTKEVAA